MSERERKRSGALSLVARIESWVRLQVLTGARPTGARLPAPDALARRFDANPNTVREAYARLAERGMVDIRHGSGVYVREAVPVDRARAIESFLDETIRRGRTLGLPPADVASSLWAASEESGGSTPIWLVDTPHPYLASFVDTLKASFDGPVSFVELGELESSLNQGVGPRAGDVVLTRFRLLRDVRARIGDHVESVYPILIRPDVKSMMAIAKRPPDQRLGFVCIDERFARSMGRSIQRQGIPHPQQYGALDDATGLEAVFRECDVVITSCAGMSRLERFANEPWFRPPLLVIFEIDPASIEAVLSLLADASKALPMAA